MKDWKPEMGIRHVLITIKCLMITPNPESALNEEAGRLLIESYDEYYRHAKLMTGVHAKGKWEEKEDASEAAPAPVEGDSDKKENNPHSGNTVASTTSAKTISKPAPAAAKTAQAAVKQKKSLKRL